MVGGVADFLCKMAVGLLLTISLVEDKVFYGGGAGVMESRSALCSAA